MKTNKIWQLSYIILLLEIKKNEEFSLKILQTIWQIKELLQMKLL